ncbi:type II secretion system protein GspN [Thermodesulfobacteriota bacterium]
MITSTLTKEFKEIIKKKERLWYGVYCFVLLILFLYLLFPSKALDKFIIQEANRVYPDLKVKIGETNISFPLGIKIESIEVTTENIPDIVFESDITKIKPGILSYVSGNRKYSFQSSTMGGNISGSVHYKNNSEKNGDKANIRFKDIRLGKRTFIHPVISRKLECIANGEINFIGDISSPVNGNFNLSLELFDGNIKLINPISQLSDIGFHKLTLAAEMENRFINITSMQLAGEGIKGFASGNIRVINNFMASRLDLKGELEFSSTFYQDMPDIQNAINILTSGREDGKLSFNVKGTIEKPRFNFNRR